MIRSAAFFLALGAWFLSSGCSEIEKPQSDAEVTDFKTLYAGNCSGCHGENGRNGAARPLNDPVFLAIIPRSTIEDLINNGRPGSLMPGFATASGGTLSANQIKSLVDGIEKNWAHPVDFHGITPPAYADTTTVGDAMNGRKTFTKACYMCHGQGAKVGLVTDPNYLATSSNQYLRSSIIVGRPDMRPMMPTWQQLNLGKPLSDQDIADLVAYLSSQRPAYSALAHLTSSQINPTPAAQ